MAPFSRTRPPTSQVRSWGFRNTASGMLETVLLTRLFLVLQDFPRISAEEPESFAAKRIFQDDVDPNPYTIGNVHKMGPTHSRCPGNPSASDPSGTWAAGSGSDGDDCVVLEVFDSLALSCAFSVTPVSADREPQVLEHVTPIDAEVGDPPAPRVRKAPASDAGSSEAPVAKRRKVSGSGPSGRKRKNAIPTSSG
jgi:hypothetical protein